MKNLIIYRLFNDRNKEYVNSIYFDSIESADNEKMSIVYLNSIHPSVIQIHEFRNSVFSKIIEGSVHQTGPHRVFIMDKWFLISELQNNMTKKVVALLLEYIKDPNCPVYDFSCGEGLSELEQASFIYAALNHYTKMNDKQLDRMEGLHP
jgi:hypothetical protein